jgi:L-ascorbate metabolism protein UlaG (beta-lactamase superfamily)
VHFLVFGATVVMASSCLTFCGKKTARHAHSPQYRDGKFRNVVPIEKISLREMLPLLWRVLTKNTQLTVPATPIPLQHLSASALINAPNASLFRLGHSTVLLKLNNDFWLTDPVFSNRVSPVQWAGPKRFHAPPISIEELPRIKGVILSHDHFDHLDRHAVIQLTPKVDMFIAPLGVGDRLIAWGIDPAKVRQLDWWENTTFGGVKLVATPARHTSGRTMTDSDQTLWASWVIIAGDTKLYFSGDTGYHDDFKTIGDRYGPFDMTFIENGAYNLQWAGMHMQPEQTLQAHIDLKGKCLLPVHNGTFDLAFHPWTEPFERITTLARQAGVKLATPTIGEGISLRHPHDTRPWWKTTQEHPAIGTAQTTGEAT